MSAEFRQLSLPGLCTWTPRRFNDARGFFMETYNAAFMRGNGLPTGFVQDNHSLSTETGVLRGLHCQLPPFAQSKLVRVARGRVLDVAVDIRKGSPGFGRWEAVELTAAAGEQLFIPRGFLHGFVTLEPMSEVLYKVDAAYSPAHELTIHWSDPALAIAWQISGEPKVSAKDAVGTAFGSFDSPFVYESMGIAP